MQNIFFLDLFILPYDLFSEPAIHSYLFFEMEDIHDMSVRMKHNPLEMVTLRPRQDLPTTWVTFALKIKLV